MNLDQVLFSLERVSVGRTPPRYQFDVRSQVRALA